jgi:hypothetical protein
LHKLKDLDVAVVIEIDVLWIGRRTYFIYGRNFPHVATIAAAHSRARQGRLP